MDVSTKIIGFDACPTNERNGTYGGQAGDKEGITYNGEYWIIKYPKSTKGMSGTNLLSYMSSPLSEYIGSHIYAILGYDVHETLLGFRNEKIVVACKDFCKQEGALREIRTLKNIYNSKLAYELEEQLNSTSSSRLVDIDDLMIHFKYNPILGNNPKVVERFWDQVVVDVLINNSDRNNGNWGLLYDQGKYGLAPVYDNGSSFYNKHTEQHIRNIYSDPNALSNSYIGISTVYKTGEMRLTGKKILSINDRNLFLSLRKNAAKIEASLPKIRNLIMGVPEEYQGIQICSKLHKEYYIKGIEERYNKLLLPALQAFINRENQMLP